MSRSDIITEFILTVILLSLLLVGIGLFIGENTKHLDKIQSQQSSLLSQIEEIKTTPVPTFEPTKTPTPEITPTSVVISLIPKYLKLPTGSTGEFKSIERMSQITKRDSKQWYLQQIATTDELGFRRLGPYYLVAMANYYAGNEIGRTFEIQFEGNIIKLMIGDVKRNSDTITEMYCKENGSIVEFIVDEKIMSPDILHKGDVSSLGMQGKVMAIIREEY